MSGRVSGLPRSIKLDLLTNNSVRPRPSRRERGRRNIQPELHLRAAQQLGQRAWKVPATRPLLWRSTSVIAEYAGGSIFMKEMPEVRTVEVTVTSSKVDVFDADRCRSPVPLSAASGDRKDGRECEPLLRGVRAEHRRAQIPSNWRARPIISFRATATVRSATANSLTWKMQDVRFVDHSGRRQLPSA